MTAFPKTALRLVARNLPALLLLLALGWLAADRLEEIDLANAALALKTIEISQWLTAIAATGLSFWAVGHYDGILHAWLGTGRGGSGVRHAGRAAVAVSQTLGFGLVSGALVRWRLTPGLSLWQATRLTFAVAISFTLAWAVAASTAILVAGPATPTLQGAAASVLGVAALGFGVLLVPPRGLAPVLPSARLALCLFGWAAVDLLFAAIALFALIPVGHAPQVADFLPAAIGALGLATAGGLPGGAGILDAALIVGQSSVDPTHLMTAIIAFRAVYHVLPGIVATVMLLIPVPLRVQDCAGIVTASLSQRDTSALDHSLDTARRAETGLLRAGRLAVLSAEDGEPLALAAKTGQALACIFDPLVPGRRDAQVLDVLQALSRGLGVTPCLYKIGRRTAAVARRRHWTVLPIASEAWLAPRCFDPDVPQRRQLRRKMRQAERGGVWIERVTGPLPFARMAQVAGMWRCAHGGERGFSMGTFDRDQVSRQQVFLGWQGGRLIAFATFHANRNEWTLDLMRHLPDTPSGTMHLIVATAIADAAREGCPRVSLASVPTDIHPAGRALNLLKRRLDASTGAAGLRQFKSSFAPQWETLYAAAPGRFGLSVGLAEIARQVAGDRVTGTRRWHLPAVLVSLCAMDLRRSPIRAKPRPDRRTAEPATLLIPEDS